jgi:23S rRNA (uridine2552-2'-O)-methyltransferase
VKRVKTAKGRKVSSTRWLERQLNDPYVRRAKAENYRSRAAYKLLELDERFGLLKGVKAVVDLGITPGGWSQVVRRKTPAASVVGIDLLPTDPIDGVAILQMDFMDDAAPDRLKEALGGPADLVMSDMAANTVGHQQTDHLRTMALVEAGLEFAREVLRPGGAYVAKALVASMGHLNAWAIPKGLKEAEAFDAVKKERERLLAELTPEEIATRAKTCIASMSNQPNP